MRRTVLRWIKELADEDVKPRVELIAKHPERNCRLIEMSYIRVFKAAGFNLTNATTGGDGTRGLKCSEEAKKKISMRRRVRRFLQYIERAL